MNWQTAWTKLAAKQRAAAAAWKSSGLPLTEVMDRECERKALSCDRRARNAGTMLKWAEMRKVACTCGSLLAVVAGPSRHKVGTSVTIHSSPTLKTHGTVVGHTGTGAYKIAIRGREHEDPVVASAEKVLRYEKPKRAARTGEYHGRLSAGARIQKFLNKPHLS